MAILRNKFVREDGSAIDSSMIISCKYTSSVNSQTNLTVGDTTADEVEVEIRTPENMVVSGEKLIYYQIEDGVENLVGIFYAEAPTVATKTSIRFTAYDGKAKLATDFSAWLNENQDKFPCTLFELASYACEVAGLEMSEENFEFTDMSVPAFYAENVTARQIISWAAQINGTFIKCTEDGKISFSWFSDTETVIDKTQYFQDSFSKKTYATDLIQRVRINQSDDDIGVIFPEEASGNVFTVSQNGILALLETNTIQTVAEFLYEKLKTVTYTPISLNIARTAKIKAGDIISVVDASGETTRSYVMQVSTDSNGTAISSTGDQNYSDKVAVSSEKYANIPGKVLNLRKDVDGLRVENKDTAGRLATIDLNLEGITATVESQSESMDTVQQSVTALQQTADGLKVSVEKVQTEGVSQVKTEKGFSFNDDGLTISQSGSAMENRLDETGMYVTRSGETILQANNTGVVATDVSVRNYLIIGQHARFEDYESDRTACFWI